MVNNIASYEAYLFCPPAFLCKKGKVQRHKEEITAQKQKQKIDVEKNDIEDYDFAKQNHATKTGVQEKRET